MGVKEGDEIDTYEASKEKELGNWAILMDYKDASPEERAMSINRHIYKMKKVKRG